MIHYFEHHLKVDTGYMADMKKYHLAHHYQSKSRATIRYIVEKDD